MKKVCPRCGVTHECIHNDISQCHCANAKLDTYQRAYLDDNYLDCLCQACLSEVKESFYISGVNPLYSKKKKDDKESTDSQQR